MKLVPVFLCVSLLSNAALLGVVVHRSQGLRAQTAPPPTVADDRSHAGGGAAAERAVEQAGTQPVPVALAEMLRSDSPERVRDALRAAGLSPRFVRAVVSMMIAEKYRERLEALRPGGTSDPQRYWRQERRPMDVATMIERNRLSREMSREIEAVMGPGDESGRNNDRFAFLDEAKRRQLETIERDYGELRNEMNAATVGFALRSDREMQRMLEDERRADIAAVLTPEEFADWERRMSQTTSRIRSQYGSVLETEEEFLAVYELQKAFDDRFNPSAAPWDRPVSTPPNQADAEARRTAERELRNQINGVLGPERVAQLARDRDPDYRTMQAATARLGLPSTATAQVLDLRAQVAGWSQQVAADTPLDSQHQKDAFAALATTAREELGGILGPEGAEAFAERTSWIRALERGSSFSVRPEGGVDLGSRPRPNP